jgi:hypothetical protein
VILGRGNAETEANETEDREGPFAPDVSSQKFLCHPKKAPPSLLRLLTVQRMKGKQKFDLLAGKAWLHIGLGDRGQNWAD